MELQCLNAKMPDKYGHYREAKFSQIKHHWFWKVRKWTCYLLMILLVIVAIIVVIVSVVTTCIVSPSSWYVSQESHQHCF